MYCQLKNYIYLGSVSSEIKNQTERRLIRVNYLGDYDSFTSLEAIADRLDELSDSYPVSTINWAGFDYKPDVRFKIARSKDELLIKYYVREDYLKAEKTRDNEMVCEDSCVEFFISPRNDGFYYNFEFNAIGTCYLGSGTGRSDTAPVKDDIVSRVRRYSSVGEMPFAEIKGKHDWELTVGIPLGLIFGGDQGEILGKRVKANFYKCGDKLSRPHFLSWSSIESAEPDFHRPEFFGDLLFV